MSARAGPVHPVPFAARLHLFGPVCSSLPFPFFSSLPSLSAVRFHCPGHPLGLGGPSASAGWGLRGASRGQQLHRCHLGLEAHSRCQSRGSSRVWPLELPLGPLGSGAPVWLPGMGGCGLLLGFWLMCTLSETFFNTAIP